jgi:hypothetical protein
MSLQIFSTINHNGAVTAVWPPKAVYVQISKISISDRLSKAKIPLQTYISGKLTLSAFHVAKLCLLKSIVTPTEDPKTEPSHNLLCLMVRIWRLFLAEKAEKRTGDFKSFEVLFGLFRGT